jgi:radical SAM protein with 4Fe4S-binding SPASM domain
LKCKHCRAEAKYFSDPAELTTAEAKSMMEDLDNLGKPILVFSGGEPLMRRDLFELMDYGRTLGTRMALATNGTLVDEATADRVARAGLHRVSISLDGPDAATHDGFRQSPGAFAASVAAIRALVARGVAVQVNTSATAHNAGQLPAILSLTESLGCVAWHLFMLVPVGCGLEIPENDRLRASQYESTLRWFVTAQLRSPVEMKATCAPHVTRVASQFRPVDSGWSKVDGKTHDTIHRPSHPSAQAGKGCLAGTGICFISRFGQVQGCGYLPVGAGNVRLNPLSHVWEHSALFAQLRQPSRLEGKCGLCDYAATCGGCRARAFSATGNVFAPEPLCAYEPPIPVPAI